VADAVRVTGEQSALRCSLAHRRGRAFTGLAVAVLGASAVLTGTAGPVRAASVPTGFTHVIVASGLPRPAAMAIAPDGRVFVTEKGGYTNAGSPLQARVRVIKNGVLLPTPFVTLTNVYGGGERGLLGITFDPAFATNHYVYVFYTAKITSTTYRNRVSRLIANGDLAQAVGGVPTEKVLIQLDLADSENHQAGGLHFGKDGKLYVSTGENKAGIKAQDLSSTYGKVLRINSDGTIPADNPFVGRGATGIYQSIWATGFRNPFTFAIQPGTGRMLINDVGESTWEEIDEGVAGSNYGWPTSEGPTGTPGFRGPLYYYGHTASPSNPVSGCAITGGTFYNPTTNQFPASFTGSYLFADFCGGWIKRLDPATGTVTDFVQTDPNPIDLQVAPDGSLYCLTEGGEVIRIAYTGSTGPSISQGPAPVTVSVGEPATFSVSATGPGALTYQWQRSTTSILGATSSSYTVPAAAMTDNGTKLRVLVTNAAGTVVSAPAILTVTLDKRPEVSITSPTGASYSGGDLISYSATANDAEDGVLPDSAFAWDIDLFHDSHVHPFLDGLTGVSSGAFVVPKVGEVSPTVWYRIRVTVTDSGGLTQTAYSDVLPRTATIGLATVPPGLAVELDGQPQATPASVLGVQGITRTLNARSPQVAANGDSFTFVSWSDGLTASHPIDTPTAPTTYTATFRKATGPDLVVTAISASPVAPVAGQTVRLSATIKNIGTAATPAGTIHGVLFKVGGQNVAYSDVSTAALPAGASRAISAMRTSAGYTAATGGLWKATAGQPTVQAVVDDLNRIAEVNELNNTGSRRVAVGPRPDLVVTSVTASPGAPSSGQPVRFTAVVRNAGTVATPAGVIIGVAFRIDGRTVTFSDTSTTALVPGTSRTLSATGGGVSGTWLATSGAHTLQAYVDDIDRITEVSESNNTVSRTLAVP
jgi:glucose/arabinose dehydrogenase